MDGALSGLPPGWPTFVRKEKGSQRLPVAGHRGLLLPASVVQHAVPAEVRGWNGTDAAGHGGCDAVAGRRFRLGAVPARVLRTVHAPNLGIPVVDRLALRRRLLDHVGEQDAARYGRSLHTGRVAVNAGRYADLGILRGRCRRLD